MILLETTQQSQNLFQLIFVQGGIVVYVILLLSLVAVYIFVERLMTLRKAAQDPDALMKKVSQAVHHGNIPEAKAICSSADTPTARMIEKGLSRLGSPLKNIETSIEYVGKIELYRLEKNLALLATIASAAPMLGFLGTVMGMIQTFMDIANYEGAVNPQILSGGIYTALITTVVGLVVGIISSIAYNYMVTRVEKVIHQMENAAMDFMDLLHEPKK